MPARITPLRLEAFDQLPKHARRCVFWELDPATLNGPDRRDQLADPEFEKEAWLSMVMLEWGCCGQLAVARSSPSPARDDETGTFDDHCLGFAFYAPPRAVPRAQLFPSGPVSADAVLLTSLGAEAGADGDRVTRDLVTSVITDLVRRGVRAVEAFGRTAEASEWTAMSAVPAELAVAVEVLGDCSVQQCVIDADFLIDAGFTVATPHRYFPRLRLELEQGLGWKADVEAALERLLETAELQPAMTSLQPVAAAQVCRHPGPAHVERGPRPVDLGVVE